MNNMDTLIHSLKLVGIGVLAFEALLVIAIVALIVDHIITEIDLKEKAPRAGKHRSNEETVLERAKRELREAKEKAARENAFFNEYFIHGFYKTGEQARRDNQVMAVFNAEEV